MVLNEDEDDDDDGESFQLVLALGDCALKFPLLPSIPPPPLRLLVLAVDASLSPKRSDDMECNPLEASSSSSALDDDDAPTWRRGNKDPSLPPPWSSSSSDPANGSS